MDLTDAHLAQLDSIEQRLVQLGEELLLGEIDRRDALPPRARRTGLLRCGLWGHQCALRSGGLTLARGEPDLGRALWPGQSRAGEALT